METIPRQTVTLVTKNTPPHIMVVLSVWYLSGLGEFMVRGKRLTSVPQKPILWILPPLIHNWVFFMNVSIYSPDIDCYKVGAVPKCRIMHLKHLFSYSGPYIY